MRNREFLKLWTGQAISVSGSAITTVALPLAAVLTLDAGPVEMGLLAALSVLPHLVFGLPAGIWVGRISLRRLLVGTDVGRAVLLGSIPVLAAFDLLRMPHLYAVAFLAGLLTLLSDTASMTLLPVLVPREELMSANSAIMLNQSVATTVGPSISRLPRHRGQCAVRDRLRCSLVRLLRRDLLLAEGAATDICRPPLTHAAASECSSTTRSCVR